MYEHVLPIPLRNYPSVRTRALLGMKSNTQKASSRRALHHSVTVTQKLYHCKMTDLTSCPYSKNYIPFTPPNQTISWDWYYDKTEFSPDKRQLGRGYRFQQHCSYSFLTTGNGPQNAREWWLFYEGRARTTYRRIASHTHHKLELVARGFMILKSKPFLGASLDNIQKCQGSEGCLDSVVDINCPGNSEICIQKVLF